MKKIIVFIAFVAIAMSCSKQDKIVIKGSFEEEIDKKIALHELVVTETKLVDTVSLKGKSSFKFSFKASEPNFYLISIGKKYYTVFANPGVKLMLNFSKNLQDYEVQGSEESKVIKKMNEDLFLAKAKIDTLMDLYRSSKNLPDFELLRDSINKAFTKVYITHRKELISEIIRNQNSIVSVYALYLQYDKDNYVLNDNTDINYIKLVAEKLQEKYPNHKQTKALLNDLESITRRLDELKFKNLINDYGDIQEKSLFDIKLKDINGKTQGLNDLKGKVVLLNFWASWSKSSMENNPVLLDIYKKYRNKGFEIYAVSLDSSRTAWKRAIDFDVLPWINVSDLNFPESEVANLYNITKLPTNFLIDGEQNILGKDFGPKELERILSGKFN